LNSLKRGNKGANHPFTFISRIYSEPGCQPLGKRDMALNGLKSGLKEMATSQNINTFIFQAVTKKDI